MKGVLFFFLLVSLIVSNFASPPPFFLKMFIIHYLQRVVIRSHSNKLLVKNRILYVLIEWDKIIIIIIANRDDPRSKKQYQGKHKHWKRKTNWNTVLFLFIIMIWYSCVHCWYFYFYKREVSTNNSDLSPTNERMQNVYVFVWQKWFTQCE